MKDMPAKIAGHITLTNHASEMPPYGIGTLP